MLNNRQNKPSEEIKSIYLKLLKRGIIGLSLNEFASQYQSNNDFLAKMELFTSLHEYCQRADIFNCVVDFPLSFIKILFDKYLPHLPALAHARFIKAFHQKQEALDPNPRTWTNPDRLNAFISKLIATTGDIPQALMIFEEIFAFLYRDFYTHKFIQFINQAAPFDKEQLGWLYIENYSDYMHRYHVNCQEGGIYHDLYRSLQDLHQHILKLRSQQRHNKANQVSEKVFDLYLLFGNLVTRSEDPRIFAKKINDILADEDTQKIINQHQSPWRKFLRAFYEFLQHLCLGFGFYNNNYKRGGYVKTETAAILNRINNAAKNVAKKTQVNPYIQQIQDIYTQHNFNRQPQIDEQEIFKTLCAQYVSSSQSKSIFSKAPLSSLASTLAQATDPFTQLNQHLVSIDLSKAPEFNNLLWIYFLSHPQAMERLDPAIRVKINAKTFCTTHFDSEAITKLLIALNKTGFHIIDKHVIEEINKAYPECIGPTLNYLLSCLGAGYFGKNRTASLVSFKDIMPTAIRSQLFERLLVLLDQVPSDKDYYKDEDIAELLGKFAADLPEADKVRAAQGLAKAIQGLNNRYDFTGHHNYVFGYYIYLTYITALAKIIGVIADPDIQKQMTQFLSSQCRQYGYTRDYTAWCTIATHINNEEFHLDIANKFLTNLSNTAIPLIIIEQLGMLASTGTPKVKSKIIQDTLDRLWNNLPAEMTQKDVLSILFSPMANKISLKDVLTIKQEVESVFKNNSSDHTKEITFRILKVIEGSQPKNIVPLEQKYEIETKPQQNQEAVNAEQPITALAIPKLHQRLNLFNPLHAAMLREQIMGCWNDFYARKLEETTQFMENLLDHIAPEQYAYFLHIYLPSCILPGKPKDRRDLAFIYLTLHLGNLPQIHKVLKKTLHDSEVVMPLELVNMIAKYA